MSKSSAIVYWLIPAKDERELFCEIIRILYKQFGAPNFEPHLTILTASEHRQSPRKVLPQINSAPIRLKVRHIAFSSQFTKTLFVRFKPSKALHKLIVDLCRVTKSRTKSLGDPHVSLLYKKLRASAKKELASTIRLPFREVIFDSIKAVRCALPTRDHADVKAWRVIATKSLSG